MHILRTSEITRITKETKIFVKLNLDGVGKSKIDTSIGFLNHMIYQISFHSLIDLEIKAQGDIEVDYHHIIEDIGITFGSALLEAIKEKKGILRYGYSYVPLDESLSRVVIDFSGRPSLEYNISFLNFYIGFLNLDLIKEFFLGVVNNAKITLHIDNIRGINAHHQIESIFKAFGRALRMAISYDKQILNIIPSTKGIL